MAQFVYENGFQVHDVRQLRADLYLNYPAPQPEMSWSVNLSEANLSLSALGACLGGDLQLAVDFNSIPDGFSASSYHIYPNYIGNRLCLIWAIDSNGDEHRIFAAIAQEPRATDQIDVWNVPLLPLIVLKQELPIPFNDGLAQNSALTMAPFGNQPRLYDTNYIYLDWNQSQSYESWWRGALAQKNGGEFGIASDLNFVAGWMEYVPNNKKTYYDLDYRATRLSAGEVSDSAYLSGVLRYVDDPRYQGAKTDLDQSSVTRPAWTPERIEYVQNDILTYRGNQTDQLADGGGGSGTVSGTNTASVNVYGSVAGRPSDWEVKRAYMNMGYNAVSVAGTVRIRIFAAGKLVTEFDTSSNLSRIIGIPFGAHEVGGSVAMRLEVTGLSSSSAANISAYFQSGNIQYRYPFYQPNWVTPFREHELLRRVNNEDRSWEFNLQGAHGGIWVRGLPNATPEQPCTSVIQYRGSVDDSGASCVTQVRSGPLPAGGFS